MLIRLLDPSKTQREGQREMLAFWQFSGDFNFELHSQITKKKEPKSVGFSKALP